MSPPLLYQGLVLITNRIWQKWWYGAPPDSFIKNSVTSVLCSLSLFISISPCLSFSLCLLLPTTMWVNLDVGLLGISLVAQWLRLCPLLQGMRVQTLVGELDATCPRAKKPKHKTEAILYQVQYKFFKIVQKNKKWIFHPCQAFRWGGHLHQHPDCNLPDPKPPGAPASRFPDPQKPCAIINACYVKPVHLGYCLTQQYVSNSKYEYMSNSESEHNCVDMVLSVMVHIGRFCPLIA